MIHTPTPPLGEAFEVYTKGNQEVFLHRPPIVFELGPSYFEFIEAAKSMHVKPYKKRVQLLYERGEIGDLARAAFSEFYASAEQIIGGLGLKATTRIESVRLERLSNDATLHYDDATHILGRPELLTCLASPIGVRVLGEVELPVHGAAAYVRNNISQMPFYAYDNVAALFNGKTIHYGPTQADVGRQYGTTPRPVLDVNFNLQ